MASLGALDKLAPELRNLIYHGIFGPTQVITPIRGADNKLRGDQLLQPGAKALFKKARMHICILATNKGIHKEALHILYHKRNVRGNIRQLYDLLPFRAFRENVMKIEVDNYTKYFLAPFGPTLLRLQGLPRNPSTVILSDHLGLNGTPRGFHTVREFAMREDLGEVSCIDVGKFSLSGKFKGIQIINRRLVKMWPEVMDTPKDYNPRSDILALIHATPLSLQHRRLPVWAAQTSLRQWIGLADVLSLEPDDLDDLMETLEGEEQSLLRRFLVSIRLTAPLPRRSLSTLRPGDSPDTLEAATNFISIKIAGYGAESNYINQPIKFLAAHWAATDGGMHTFEAMSMHIRSALNGEVNDHYLPYPVLKGATVEISHIRALIRREPRHIMWDKADRLSTRELRQIHLLIVATKGGRVRDEFQRMMDEWSLHLFKRYLLATGSVHADEVKNATLQDTRLSMSSVLNLLRKDRNRRGPFQTILEQHKRQDFPMWLDTDLTRRLAWQYNWVFVYFWRCIVYEGLSQWQDEQHVEGRLMDLLGTV
jgi:hypothetical protein